MGKVVSAKTGTITENGKVTGNIYSSFTGAWRAGGTPVQQDVLVKAALKQPTVEKQQVAIQKKAVELGLQKAVSVSPQQLIKEQQAVVQSGAVPSGDKGFRTVKVYDPSIGGVRVLHGSQQFIDEQASKIGRESKALRESKEPGFFGRFIRPEGGMTAEQLQALRIKEAQKPELVFDKPSREMTSALPSGVSAEAGRIANQLGVSVNDIVSFDKRGDSFRLEHRNPVTSKIELMTGFSQDPVIGTRGLVSRAGEALGVVSQMFVPKRTDEVLKERIPTGRIDDFRIPAYKRKKIVQEQIGRYSGLPEGEVLRRAEELSFGLYSTSFDVLKGGFDIATDFGVGVSEKIKESPFGPFAQKAIREFEITPRFVGVSKEELPAVKPFGKVISGEISAKQAKERVAVTGALLEQQVLEFGLLFGAGKAVKGFAQTTGILADVGAAVVPAAEGVFVGSAIAGAKTLSKYVLPKIPKGAARTGYKYVSGISAKGLLPAYFGYQTLKAGEKAKEVIALDDVIGARKFSVQAATGLAAFSFGAEAGFRTTTEVLSPIEAGIELQATLKKMPLKERLEAERVLKISEKLGEQEGVLKGKQIKSFKSVRVERLTKKEVSDLTDYLETEPSAIVGGTASTQPQLKAKAPKAADVDIYSPEYKRVAREAFNVLKESGETKISLVGANTKNPRIYIRGKKAVEFHDIEQLLLNLGKTRKFFEPTAFSVTKTPEGVRIVKFSAQIKRKAAGGIEQPERRSKDFPYVVDVQRAMGLSTKELFKPRKGLLYEEKAQITFPEFKVKVLEKDLTGFGVKPTKTRIPKEPELRAGYKTIAKDIVLGYKAFGLKGVPRVPYYSRKGLEPRARYLIPVQKYIPSAYFGKQVYTPFVSYKTPKTVSRTYYDPYKRIKTPSYPKTPGYPRVPGVPYIPGYPSTKTPGYPVTGIPGYTPPYVPSKIPSYITGYPRVPGVPKVPGYPDIGVPRIPPTTEKGLLPGESQKRFLDLRKRTQQAFKAVITAKGKPSIESRALTRLGALQAGILRTGRTAKRTFKVVAVPGIPKRTLKLFDVERSLRERYRKPVRKGVPQFGSKRWIEKTRFAIDTEGELAEITFAPRRKIKRKKRKRRP